jgi:hypothetical protein
MFEDLEAVIVRALVFEDIRSQGHTGCLALFTFGVVLVENLHLTFPGLDGLHLNLVQVHGTILILRVFGLDLKLL